MASQAISGLLIGHAASVLSTLRSANPPLPSPLLDGLIREERSPSQLRATPGRRFHDESRIASVPTSGRFGSSTTHTEHLPSSFSDRRRFLQIFAAAPPTLSHVLLFVTVAVVYQHAVVNTLRRRRLVISDECCFSTFSVVAQGPVVTHEVSSVLLTISKTDAHGTSGIRH